MNSFMGWIGGKRLLRNDILARFPSDGIERYIEVCGGAGWVLFAKPQTPKQMEVYNDRDGDLVNLYRCIKYHCAALQEELDGMLSAREQFLDCQNQLHSRGLQTSSELLAFFILSKLASAVTAKRLQLHPKVLLMQEIISGKCKHGWPELSSSSATV